MKTIPFGILTIAGALALAGCSSTPTTLSQESLGSEGVALTFEASNEPQQVPNPGSLTFEASHPFYFFDAASTVTVPAFFRFGIDRFEVDPGEGFDGVVELFLPSLANPNVGFRCSGTLMPTGRHILTAAHCFNSTGVVGVSNPTVFFDLPGGRVQVQSVKFDLHPDWTGLEVIAPGDIAVVKLAEEAPAAAERFDIYRDSDEVGQVVTKVGYGRIGTGRQGAFDSNPDSRKLIGENRVDTTYDVCVDAALGTNAGATQLGFDFDNRRLGNDAYDFLCGFADDRGEGGQEVGLAPGDSGGPLLIDSKVAGVTSHGFTFGNAPGPDVDNQLNSSFGEFIGDTRVSFYQDWIDDRLAE